MSKLISGKDALIALANGVDVEFNSHMSNSVWLRAKELKASEILNHCMVLGGDKYSIEFRLKPRAITLNGVELSPCYSVGIDRIKNEVSIQFKDESDAEKLHDLLAELFGFRG